MMFESYPTYSRYRSLLQTNPLQTGEDVYALQMALVEAQFDPGPPDGVFGEQTAIAVRRFQRAVKLANDGIAGGLTQKALALRVAGKLSLSLGVPITCFHGQLEHESGFRLGNYSPQRPDGTYDAGVAQRNTAFTKPEKGFDPAASIQALGEVVRRHYELFEGLHTHRRWALAQGAWNAPAFACYLAREEGAKKVTERMTLRPASDSRATFEAYVRNVSAYLP